MNKKYISTREAAEIMGISRMAVVQKIQQGQIKAEKVGRSYMVDRDSLNVIYKEELTKEEKKQIEKAVKKTVKDFGEALKKLGSE